MTFVTSHQEINLISHDHIRALCCNEMSKPKILTNQEQNAPTFDQAILPCACSCMDTKGGTVIGALQELT